MLLLFRDKLDCSLVTVRFRYSQKSLFFVFRNIQATPKFDCFLITELNLFTFFCYYIFFDACLCFRVLAVNLANKKIFYCYVLHNNNFKFMKNWADRKPAQNILSQCW